MSWRVSVIATPSVTLAFIGRVQSMFPDTAFTMTPVRTPDDVEPSKLETTWVVSHLSDNTKALLWTYSDQANTGDDELLVAITPIPTPL